MCKRGFYTYNTISLALCCIVCMHVFIVRVQVYPSTLTLWKWRDPKLLSEIWTETDDLRVIFGVEATITRLQLALYCLIPANCLILLAFVSIWLGLWRGVIARDYTWVPYITLVDPLKQSNPLPSFELLDASRRICDHDAFFVQNFEQNMNLIVFRLIDTCAETYVVRFVEHRQSTDSK